MHGHLNVKFARSADVASIWDFDSTYIGVECILYIHPTRTITHHFEATSSKPLFYHHWYILRMYDLAI